MTLPSRQQTSFRMTEAQADRLDKTLRRRGQTMQAFVLSVVMRAIEEDEAEDRVAQDGRQRRREARDARRQVEAPSGLGLRPRPVAAEAPPPPAPATPPPVQVVVHGSGSPAPAGTGASGGDIIQRLAAFVTTGPEYTRGERLRQTVEILRVSSGTEEERLALAQQLDAAVAARVKSEPNEIEKARRALSMSYDRVKEFLR